MSITLADLDVRFSINLDSLKAGLSQAQQGIQSFATQATTAKGQVTAFGQAANAAGGATGIFKERLADAKISLQQLGGAVTATGRLLTATLTVPLAALGAASLSSAGDVNEAMALIEARTGATGNRAASLAQSFKNLGGQVPNSLQEVGQALGQLAQRTGLTGSALEALAKQELTLKRVTGDDLNSVVRDSARVFAQWGIAVQEQPAHLDQLFRASQATGIPLKELETLLIRQGATLHGLGFSFSEATALLGSFEQHGENTQRIAMALNQGLSAMAKAGITDAHQALGVLVEKIKAAPSSVAAMTEVVKIFGTRGASVMVKAVQDGAFAIDKLDKTILTGKQTISAAGQQTETFALTWQRLRNNVELALAPLGASLQQVLSRLVDLMVPALQHLQGLAATFAQLPFPVKAAAVALAGLAAAIGPVVVVGGTLLAQVPQLAAGWAVLSTAATETLVPALSGIGVTLLALLPQAALAAGAFLLLKTAWDRDLGHARSTLTEFWVGSKTIFEQNLTAIGQAMASNWPKIVADFESGWQIATTALAKGWDVIQQAVSSGIGQVKQFLVSGWDAVTAPFRSAFSNLPPFVTTVFQGVANVVKTAFETITKYIHDAAPGLFDTLAKVGGFFAHWFNKSGFDSGLKQLQDGWAQVRAVGQHAIAQAEAENAAAAARAQAQAKAALAAAGGTSGAGNTAAAMSKLLAGGKMPKESPTERKEAELKSDLAGQQQRLNELLAGEGNIAGQVAAKYHLLTSAADQSLKSQLVATEQRIKNVEKAISGEQRYHEALAQTEAKIRELQGGTTAKAAVGTDFGPRVNPAQIKFLAEQKQRLEELGKAQADVTAFGKQLDAQLAQDAAALATSTTETKKGTTAEEELAKAIALGIPALIDKAAAHLANVPAIQAHNAAIKEQLAQLDATRQAVQAFTAVELHQQEIADKLGGAGKQLTEVQKALNLAYASGDPFLIAWAQHLADVAAAQDRLLKAQHDSEALTGKLNSLMGQATAIIDQHGVKVGLTTRAQEDLNAALKLGDPAVVKLAQDTLAAAQAADKMTAGQSQFQQALKKTSDFFQNEFTKGFEGFFKTGLKNFFPQLLADLDSLLQQMAAKILAANLTSLLFGSVTAPNATGGAGSSASSGGGLLGGLIGAIGGAFGGLFGGGGTADAGVGGLGIGGSVLTAADMAGLAGAQSGGYLLANQPRLVGESGPEAFIPSQSGYLIPNQALAQSAAGTRRSGGSTTIHMTVVSPDAAGFKKSQGQIMADMHRTAEARRIRDGG